jgi:hypothetical protein
MKLNLRKSSALQLAINEQIALAEMPLSVTIERYDLPLGKTSNTAEKFAVGLTKKRELFEVLYSIRQKTSAASEQAGVSSLLAESAQIEKLIALLNPLSLIRDFAKTTDQLTEALADLRKEAATPVQYAHLRRESFETSIITEDQTKEWKKEIADLKRRKQGISDALLEANVKNEIEVSEQEEVILKKYGIL